MAGEHRLSVEAAALELEQAARQSSAVKPLRDRVQDASLESAYAVQEFQTRAGLADDRLTSADAVHAIEAVCAAIEIVDSRIENWDIGLFDTVADNGSPGSQHPPRPAESPQA